MYKIKLKQEILGRAKRLCFFDMTWSIETDASSNSSTVACEFVDAVTLYGVLA
jgi:hypothetical protein